MNNYEQNERRSRQRREIDIRHEEHHRWIEEAIEAEKARKSMYYEIAKTVAQWSVIGVLSACVYYATHGHWPT